MSSTLPFLSRSAGLHRSPALPLVLPVLLLVATLLASIVPVPALVLPAPAGATEIQVVDWPEIEEARTAFTRTLAGDEGREVVEIGSTPLHYRHPDSGDWLPIDPRLEDLGGEGWENTSNSFPVRLPRVLGGGESVRLGPDFGLAWRPGTLGLRLTSGTLVELSAPSPSVGSFVEETNAVVYPELYPGVDLHLRSRAGRLLAEAHFTDWPHPWTGDEIARLSLDSELSADGALLAEIDARLQGGEEATEVPLAFGPIDATDAGDPLDALMIVLDRDPGIDPPALLAAAPALGVGGDDDPAAAALAAGWESPLGRWLDGGTVRWWLDAPHLELVEGELRVGSDSMALVAGFLVESRRTVRHRRLFGSRNPAGGGNAGAGGTHTLQAIGLDSEGDPIRTVRHDGRIAAGRTADGWYRSEVVFRGLQSLRPYADRTAGRDIVGVWLGKRDAGAQAPAGVTAYSPDHVVSTDWRLHDPTPSSDGEYVFNWTRYLLGTLDGEWTQIPGTEVLEASTVRTVLSRFIDNSWYTFGPMVTRFFEGSKGSPGSREVLLPEARLRLRQALRAGDDRWSIPLRNPYDSTSCRVCTDIHPDPAVQALQGSFEVGGEWDDVRLLVETVQNHSLSASLAVDVVGGGPAVLRPGGSVDFDIRLATLTGGAGSVRLTELAPDPAIGLETLFLRNGQPEGDPTLSSGADRLTYRVTWRKAAPALYGTPDFPLELAVGFDVFPWHGTVTAGPAVSPGSNLKLPVDLEPPAASLTVHTASGGTVLSSITHSMETLGIFSAQSFDGAQAVEMRVEAVPGSGLPVLVRGVHWWTDVLTGAPSSTQGGVVLVPSALRVGVHELEVTPCLRPAGQLTAVHCLDALTETVRIDIQPGPTQAPPVIDRLEPWSLDAGSAASTLRVAGVRLGGTTTAVSTSPALPVGAPVAGSATELSLPVGPIPSGFCGPVDLTLQRADGESDTTVLNVTRPFRNGAPHLVFEAETGSWDPTLFDRLPTTDASNGEALGKNQATVGQRGTLEYSFRVPSASADWQVYLRAAPEQSMQRHYARIIVRDDANRTVANFVWAETLSGTGYRVVNYGNGGTPLDRKLDLDPARTYRLVISNEPSLPFPRIDMVVFSAGTLPPLDFELCR